MNGERSSILKRPFKDVYESEIIFIIERSLAKAVNPAPRFSSAVCPFVCTTCLHFKRIVSARDLHTPPPSLPFPCDRVVLLLLSSGYIGLRIVALEEQLTSLGALSDFTLHSG